MKRPISAGAICLLVGACAMPAVAQTIGQATESGPPVWRVLLALLLCLGLAVAGAFALRWRMRGGGSPLPLVGQRRLILIERTRLNHQVDLCLVKCDQREFLITTSPRDSRFGPEITARASGADGGDGA